MRFIWTNRSLLQLMRTEESSSRIATTAGSLSSRAEEACRLWSWARTNIRTSCATFRNGDNSSWDWCQMSSWFLIYHQNEQRLDLKGTRPLNDYKQREWTLELFKDGLKLIYYDQTTSCMIHRLSLSWYSYNSSACAFVQDRLVAWLAYLCSNDSNVELLLFLNISLHQS